MTTRSLALVLVLMLAGWAQAEDKKPKTGPRIQQFEEIERGFFLRTNFGVSLAVMNHFGEDSLESPIWPPGPVIELELGFDLGQVASLHLTIHGQQVTGTRDLAARGSVPNDSAAIGLLIGGRFNIVTTKRLAWFLKAGVGYMLAVPDLAVLENGLVVQGGTGIDYATNLRHFFIGIELGAQYLMSNNGVAILVTPTLKYTF